jgi:hypothetical protein
MTPEITTRFRPNLSAQNPPSSADRKMPTELAPRNSPFPSGSKLNARESFVADTPAAWISKPSNRITIAHKINTRKVYRWGVIIRSPPHVEHPVKHTAFFVQTGLRIKRNEPSEIPNPLSCSA